MNESYLIKQNIGQIKLQTINKPCEIFTGKINTQSAIIRAFIKKECVWLLKKLCPLLNQMRLQKA